MTPTKRPTAGEIGELLSNNPRLISPCIDVPLASVQIERTDSLELIPTVRKPSGSISQTNRPTIARKRDRECSRESKESAAVDASTAVGGPYSPMNGPTISPPHTLITNNNSSQLHGLHGDGAREPLLGRDVVTLDHRGDTPVPGTPNSYVSPMYVMVDSGSRGPQFTDYVPSSVASV